MYFKTFQFTLETHLKKSLANQKTYSVSGIKNKIRETT